MVIGRKGMGVDGYFQQDEAFFIDADKKSVEDYIINIDKKILEDMTSKSRKRFALFKNDIIVNRYKHLINSSL